MCACLPHMRKLTDGAPEHVAVAGRVKDLKAATGDVVGRDGSGAGRDMCRTGDADSHNMTSGECTQACTALQARTLLGVPTRMYDDAMPLAGVEYVIWPRAGAATSASSTAAATVARDMLWRPGRWRIHGERGATRKRARSGEGGGGLGVRRGVSPERVCVRAIPSGLPIAAARRWLGCGQARSLALSRASATPSQRREIETRGNESSAARDWLRAACGPRCSPAPLLDP